MDEKGEQLGVMATAQALRIAEERGLDLVEVAPAASPPVCRLLDYGKFRYEATRKEREARKVRKSKVTNELREVRFRTRIGVHDRAAKTRLVKRLLDQGSKVKVIVMFRGREIAHPELGMTLLRLVAEDLADDARLERPPGFEGPLANDDSHAETQRRPTRPRRKRRQRKRRKRKSSNVPKLKTHKGAAARFRITKTGKLLRMKGQRSHLRRKKPSKVKRLYNGMLPVSPADAPRIRRLLANGSR